MNDKLDQHIDGARQSPEYHSHSFADTLEIIRDRLSVLETRYDNSFEGARWLIECGSPAVYYCNDGEWCSNPNHARKFMTKDEASNRAASMNTMDPVRVCEHLWTKP